MVQVDFNTILAVQPNELSPEEKDDMYETITIIDVEPNLPPDKLEALFRVTQEVLKYKGEQALRHLAGSQEMREELAKTVQQTEQLVEELQNKEKELTDEKSHIEKLMSELTELQKEKQDLRREILFMQQEKQSGPPTENAAESGEDINYLKETIQHKNKHILQLLSDIEAIEKENENLRAKLSTVRKEMSEATTSMTKLSGENISLRQSNYELQEKVTIVEERNLGLISQVNELVSERKNKDAQLDQLIDALEARVAKWQEILSNKDHELAELRACLNEIQQPANQPPNLNNVTKQYGILTQSIEKQEEKIEELQDHLVKATEDLTKSTELLQQFKKKAEARESGDESTSQADGLKEDLEKCHAKIALLEDKLNDAEQDAQARAEEMTELIIQLREYEDGVYGLKEARREVKELKTQVKVRDNQILKLVQQANQLHLKTINEENGENYVNFEDNEDNNCTDISDLKIQLYQIQQTAINLSMQNYDLRAELIKLKRDKGGDDSEEIQEEKKKDEFKTKETNEQEESKEYQEKLNALIEENEGLRKGLHEILENVHKHDGISNVAVESECLETLLAALDSRHVSGWYHPAMRLQVELSKVQGRNSALREQMRECRLRESYFQAELQASLIRIEELESLLTEYHKKEMAGYGSANVIPPTIPPPVPPPRRSKLESEEELECKKDESEEEVIEEEIEESIDLDKGDKEIEEPSIVEKKENEVLVLETTSQPEESKEDAIALKQATKGKEDPGTRTVSTQQDMSDITNVISGQEKPESERTHDCGIGTPSGINGAKLDPENNLLVKFTKIEENEDELREKCEQLKKELDVIRTNTESTLLQLNENKEKIYSDVGEMMRKVDEQLKTVMAQSGQTTNDLVMSAFQAQENKITKYEEELSELRKTLSEKDALVSALEIQTKELNQQLTEVSSIKEVKEGTHALTLKTTISSLQSIINQKEEVINRYQRLLKESGEEYGKLMEQYRNAEANARKLSPPREKVTDSRAVSVLVEKWLTRVHTLEDEISQLTYKLAEVNTKLVESEKQTEHWKSMAERTEEKLSEEAIQKFYETRKEIDELKVSLEEQKIEFESNLKERIKAENLKLRKKEDEHKIKIKEYENEILKLKNQLSVRALRNKNTNSAKKECLLLDRIKLLEEELAECRSRQENSLQLRRDKCAEEFSKWEEKKRLQSTNEKLKNELRDRALHIESLEMQITRLKQIISRMERERISLQRRLKMSQDGATKGLLKDLATESREAQIDEDHTATPVPTITPRSQTESAGSSNYNEEVKTRGRSRRDLEKAVVALKKVIAKLRAENSQFLQKGYVEQLQKELQRSQENYVDAVDRTLVLEEKLRDAEAKINDFNRQTYIVDAGGDRTELAHLKEQLLQKCELLSRVKVLLQRAMVRERQLVDQISRLKKFVPSEKLVHLYNDIQS